MQFLSILLTVWALAYSPMALSNGCGPQLRNTDARLSFARSKMPSSLFDRINILMEDEKAPPVREKVPGMRMSREVSTAPARNFSWESRFAVFVVYSDGRRVKDMRSLAELAELSTQSDVERIIDVNSPALETEWQNWTPQ